MNVSEGRDDRWLEQLALETAGCVYLHIDAFHNRSVLTIMGSPDALVDSVLSLAGRVVRSLDLTAHTGVHPRIGVLDVVPFVPLGHATIEEAIGLRDLAARRLSEELSIPCFLYGPTPTGDRPLPSIRAQAFRSMEPDFGPNEAHPSAGAVAVGARTPLLAWNIWLSGVPLDETRRLAASVRSADVRTLGLQVGEATQVSCNLLEPTVTTPLDVLERVLRALGGPEALLRCELVGLAPRGVLDEIDPTHWPLLDLSEVKTIEHAAASLELSL